jgi:hypothetical protein
VSAALTNVCFWLGMVDLDKPRRNFRLTPLGAFLTGQSATWDGEPAARALIVQPTFDVLAPTEAPLADVFRLADFARLVKQDQIAHYVITLDSVRAALEQGHRVDAIVQFLEEAGGRPAPQNVAYSIRDWGARYGEIKVQRMTVLTTASDALMTELTGGKKSLAPSAEILGPRAAALESGSEEGTVAALRKAGYLPQVEPGLQNSEPATGSLVPVQGADPVMLLAAVRAVRRVANTPLLLSRSVDDLIQSVGPATAQEVEALSGKLQSALEFAAAKSRPAKVPAVRFAHTLTLPLLEGAMRHGRTVELEAYDAPTAAVVHQRLDPYRIEHRQGVAYCVGYSHTALDEISVPLDHIRAVKVTDDRFTPPFGSRSSRGW